MAATPSPQRSVAPIAAGQLWWVSLLAVGHERDAVAFPDRQGGGPAYQRGPRIRLVADRPTLPIWTTADPRIVRVYQEESVVEIVRNAATGLDLAQELLFRSTVPELADLFDGSERLVAILSNP